MFLWFLYFLVKHNRSEAFSTDNSFPCLRISSFFPLLVNIKDICECISEQILFHLLTIHLCSALLKCAMNKEAQGLNLIQSRLSKFQRYNCFIKMLFTSKDSNLLNNFLFGSFSSSFAVILVPSLIAFDESQLI